MSLSKLTVAELKEKLRDLGLPVSGKKADLIERLEEAGGADGNDDDEEEEEEEEKPKSSRSTRSSRASSKKKKYEEEEDDEDEEEEEEEKPKKKAPAPKSTASKKRKAEETPDTSAPRKKSKVCIKVDETCDLDGASVYQDWAVTLNQTNIKNNNNKYYIIQLLECGGEYYCFNRWGRVGERGQNTCKGFGSLTAAMKDFEKKFKQKTNNVWADVHADRDSFVPSKYVLIDMDHEADEEEVQELEEAVDSIKKSEAKINQRVKSSTLEKPTQDLISLIFNHDMFKEQMVKFDLNVKELPLGKISQTQINKGYDALDDIADAIQEGRKKDLERLTNAFYTLIPHAFGRRTPPIISTAETVQNKRDMLAVLSDIELAAELSAQKKEESTKEEIDHPIDINYRKLDTDLVHVDKSSEEYKYVLNYLNATMGNNHKLTLLDLFKVSRHNEDERFKVHDAIENRRLLWHGTNVAVVVAILKSGLRIMPHSGGRVGKGIYFASENGKSSNYVTPAGDTGIMFLNEVALGKEWHIDQDDSSLTKAPNGYDSIVAKGWTEPDPSKDITFKFDGKDVVIPQGKPISQPKWQKSTFSQSEYLIYKESQNRIRYLLKLKFE
eukprot:TRINITY_DN623_c0_g1_i1.p1 TRINITY_DN623_c0_g1~~TRINITY_DN623_c0_g1_i1.p1  ORF type:complete len:610 (+),score=201.99 TRINITY_DN623_c0_g1_i1:62-1891(+)